MAKDKGKEWFRKENCRDKGEARKLCETCQEVKGSHAGAQKTNGDIGKSLGRKLVYQVRETSSNP